MGKDKARPGSLGARLLNFGRSRIQRYTAGDESPEPTDQGETFTPEHQQPERQSPSEFSSAPPTRPSRPAPPSELPPVTLPADTPPQETRPERPVRRTPRAAESAPPPQRPEQNAEDRPRQTIGRDLLYILQRHEELQAAQETADFDADFNTDGGDVSPNAPPTPPATPAQPTQSRRVQRESAPRQPAPTPQTAPPPGTPMPRRPRSKVEANASRESGVSPVPTPPAPTPQDISRKSAPPAAEPTENWDMTHFEDGGLDADTAALYDGDTVRYAQPETPPSAVPRRTRPTELGTDSRPVQRKPAETPKPSSTPAPRQRREQINRTPERPGKPDRPAENPPVHITPDAPPVQAAPRSAGQTAPQQHDLPLIEEAEEYEAPLMSDSFELNAGFDLTHQPPTPAAPIAPIQRSETPTPTDVAPRSSVEQSFTEALPVVLPPTRRGRGTIEELPTHLPEAYDAGEQPDYGLPYFDEEADRVTEQIDEHDHGYQDAPDISPMRQDSPVQRRPAPVQRDSHPDDIGAFADDAFKGDDSVMDEAETHDAASSVMPVSEPILPRHELPSALRRTAEGDGHVDTPSSAAPESYFSAYDAMDDSGDEAFDENPYAQDFDDTAESDFDARPDLYEALLRAGMIHNAPADAHDAPIYRAPDTESQPAALMPSFEGVYDTDDDHADDDADTIYNYDDDDDVEPVMPAEEESGEELPFGSVEGSLRELMRYADDGDTGDESSNYHTTVSFDDDDSDLYHVEFDPDADDDSGADHDDASSERTPGNMIRRYADAQADLLRLLDLPPDTPVSHGDDGGDYDDDYGDKADEDYSESSAEDGHGEQTAPRNSRPHRANEPPAQPISLADALAAPPSLPPQPYVARKMDGGDDGGTSDTGGTTNTATSETDENQNPAEKPDVDKLAREVYRRLRSKLRIEQERRSD